MTGYVYILTNPCMLGLVKIGWTGGAPEARAHRLSADTGVPMPFDVAWCCEADHPVIERLAHDRLAYCRENSRREFFRCDVATAIRAVEACNVPLGRRYRPPRASRRAGKERPPLQLRAWQVPLSLLRALLGSAVRHPVTLCVVVGLLVAIYRPDMPRWMPYGAVVRAAYAIERIR